MLVEDSKETDFRPLINTSILGFLVEITQPKITPSITPSKCVGVLNFLIKFENLFFILNIILVKNFLISLTMPSTAPLLLQQSDKVSG